MASTTNSTLDVTSIYILLVCSMTLVSKGSHKVLWMHDKQSAGRDTDTGYFLNTNIFNMLTGLSEDQLPVENVSLVWATRHASGIRGE